MGVTGLAVDKDDNVWVLDRPNDIDGTQNYAMLNPPTAECCVAPPSMIHFDKNGNVIGSFNPPEGHGMAVDSKGFVYIGNAVDGMNTVRKYDPKTGSVFAEIPRAPEKEPGGGGGEGAQEVPALGPGGTGATAAARTAARGGNQPDPAARAAATAAFRAKYPPTTPMIVGQIEEVRLDEPAREIYCADSYLGGRVMVFDLDTFAFKRGWGAYGHALSEISTDRKDRDYTPGGPEPKEFRNHLTINISKDGLVYAADRGANRIDVTSKQGKFVKEITLATETGNRGSAGGVAFSADPQAALFVYFGYFQQHCVDPQSRGRKSVGPNRQRGRLRRAVPRPAHDRHGLPGKHLHRRSAGRRTRAEICPGQVSMARWFTVHSNNQV